ncbi:MAG: ABC transporter permease subunit [Bacillota bacterium]
MSFRLWGGALLQRILLFIMAGIVAVTLLHVPAGIITPKSRQEAPTYSTERWLKATGDYLRQVSRGDLGELKALGVQGYKDDQPAVAVLKSQAPRSVSLLGIALLLSLSLGTLLGFVSSKFGHRLLRAPTLGAVLLLLSFPDILIIFLLRALVLWAMTQFGVQLLSSGTFGAFQAQDMIAPALALSAMPLVLVARVASVAFDEIHSMMYVRTAHSKGLHPGRVVIGHVLKNAWIQVADAAPLIVGSLVTGLVVVEYAFYYPGVGRTLGLMLERGGQPGAASSFALVLLAGAILTDALFGAIKLALDPRIKEREAGREAAGGRFRLSSLQALSPLALLRGLSLWLSDLPYTLGQAAWSLRPSHLLRGIWRNPPLLIGLIGILGLVSLALFGGNLADLRATGVAPKYITHNGEVFFPPFQPGLTGYPLGSDMAGRDMLSRLLVGARYTLFFTLAVTPVRFLIAVPWGLAAGFSGGIWATGGRTLSLMFAALPVMLIPAAVLPVQAVVGNRDTQSTFWLVTIVLAVVGVPRLVESVRQQVESTLVQPFVEGARATGATGGRILTRHVLPHLAPQLWVAAAADMAWTLLLLAQLGVFSIYLGGAVFVGAAYGERGGALIPRLPDWSSMLSKPYDVIYRAPWAVWVPAVAFLLAIVIFNLTAEGLRRQAQRLASKAALPEPEVLPDGTERIPPRAKRRLALEWVAATMVLALSLGVGVKYGRAEAPAPPVQLTPLEQARGALQRTLDTIYGTGDQYEKARSVSALSPTVSRYLAEAHKAKVKAADMQEDSRGRLNLFPLEGTNLIQFQVPSGILSESAFHSFIWIQDAQSGMITTANIAMKPTYAAVQKGHLIMTGTVPGPDNWEIFFFSRSDSGRWGPNASMAERVSGEIPPGFNAELVTRFNSNPKNQIRMTGGPLNSARVDPSGDVTVCKHSSGPCVTIPFEKYAR